MGGGYTHHQLVTLKEDLRIILFVLNFRLIISINIWFSFLTEHLSHLRVPRDLEVVMVGDTLRLMVRGYLEVVMVRGYLEVVMVGGGYI